jgi:hypothetical protein
LELKDQLPADMELYVAMRLRANFMSGAMPDRDEVWKKLDILFHAWQRMERETDPDYTPKYDVSDAIGVMPPAEALGHTTVPGIYPEMDPALITDERIRAKYVAAIEENNRKARASILQGTLRNEKQAFIRHIESFSSPG